MGYKCIQVYLIYRYMYVKSVGILGVAAVIYEISNCVLSSTRWCSY